MLLKGRWQAQSFVWQFWTYLPTEMPCCVQRWCTKIDNYRVYMFLWNCLCQKMNHSQYGAKNANNFRCFQITFFLRNKSTVPESPLDPFRPRQMILRGGEDLAREGASRAESGAVVGAGSPSLAPETRP